MLGYSLRYRADNRPGGAVADEPWAASAPASGGDDVWNTPGNYNDETPF